MSEALRVLLVILATWRITSLVVREDGPLDVFIKLRVKLGIRYNESGVAYGTNVISRGLSCFWCTSVWVSFATAIFIPDTDNVFWYLIAVSATSAASIALDEMLSWIGCLQE